MNRCATCRHFKIDPACVKWSTDPMDHRYGVCSIKLGDGVEIELETPVYGAGATIGDITVDAVFGCTAHQPHPEPTP